ncbi:hypothetical protein [Psychrobacillus vulpis]|uniref:hypothetical protein n=1 Tax=Psychrobacillus vulpis TaxID=2325572 RepID=UPI00140A09C2|nr:hypothetical protein [Psychrobacillus vulpis]
MEQERIDKFIEDMLKEYPREKVIGALDMLLHTPKNEADKLAKVYKKIDEEITNH